MDKDLEKDFVGGKAKADSPGLGLEKGTGHLYSRMRFPHSNGNQTELCACKRGVGFLKSEPSTLFQCLFFGGATWNFCKSVDRGSFKRNATSLCQKITENY